MRDILRRALMLAFIVPCWVSLGLLVYWSFIDTAPPAQFVSLPTPLMNENPVLKTGEMLIIHRRGCFFSEGQATVSVRFTDGVAYNVPDRVITTKPGCSDWQGAIEVPHTLNSGRYTYVATIHFKNNPISHPTITMQPVTFWLEAHFPAPGYEPPAPRSEFEGLK